MSILSETICLLTSTKSHSTVAAETTHIHNASAAASRKNGRERRRLVVRLPQGSPSSLDADSSLPPLDPTPTNASNSRRFRIFFPTLSGTAACTALSITQNRYREHIRAQTLSLSIHTCARYGVRVTNDCELWEAMYASNTVWFKVKLWYQYRKKELQRPFLLVRF